MMCPYCHSIIGENSRFKHRHRQDHRNAGTITFSVVIDPGGGGGNIASLLQARGLPSILFWIS
jgi:hypothetical protein